MQVNKTNNIVFLKNVESNIIDEAIVILKENVEINKLKENEEKGENQKINILKEAEIIVNHKLAEQNVKFEKYKVKKLEKKNKILKVVNVLLIIGSLAVFTIK